MQQRELDHCNKLPDGEGDIFRGIIPGKTVNPYLLYLQGNSGLSSW